MLVVHVCGRSCNNQVGVPWHSNNEQVWASDGDTLPHNGKSTRRWWSVLLSRGGCRPTGARPWMRSNFKRVRNLLPRNQLCSSRYKRPFSLTEARSWASQRRIRRRLRLYARHRRAHSGYSPSVCHCYSLVVIQAVATLACIPASARGATAAPHIVGPHALVAMLLLSATCGGQGWS